ncbi:MAG: sugar ABC transporter ATP-binding protein [Bacillota bacterium]|nr:sugar ABC transporter ATP-binding protein [Bacillota bacterium]
MNTNKHVNNEHIIELKNVTKYFPGVIALKEMSLKIKKGEIHGLIGENGAGKSTIIKILTGVHQSDKGDIYFENQKISFLNPVDAINVGIGCVYQELNIIKELNITDNIFLGCYLQKKNKLLDYKEMHKKTKQIMESLGQDINPEEICGNVGIGLQQMIEIGKSILNDSKLLIMDEPTSSLSGNEIKQLFKTIFKLKDRGVSILFVSHKLEEVFEICDTVTVMRDGEHISTYPTNKVNQDQLITDMVGRSLANLFPKEIAEKGDEFFRVKDLTRLGLYQNINFEAYAGEVLGFSGLVGAGRSEVFRGIFGVDEIDDGEIYVQGKQVRIKSPKDAIKNKLAFVTEDRKGQGLILNESVNNNLNIAVLDFLRKWIFIDKKARQRNSNRSVEELKIKTASINSIVGTLSGGNQQKIVIGKWLNTEANVFIFDEPTRGIDVGAKIEVYKLINELVKNGKCVIMISSELPEILGMSDRVIVMRKGKIMTEINRDSSQFNQEDIMAAAWGVVK